MPRCLGFSKQTLSVNDHVRRFCKTLRVQPNRMLKWQASGAVTPCFLMHMHPTWQRHSYHDMHETQSSTCSSRTPFSWVLLVSYSVRVQQIWSECIMRMGCATQGFRVQVRDSMNEPSILTFLPGAVCMVNRSMRLAADLPNSTHGKGMPPFSFQTLRFPPPPKVTYAT